MLRAALVKARLLPSCPTVHVAKKSHGAGVLARVAGALTAAALVAGLSGCFVDRRDPPSQTSSTGSGSDVQPPSKDPPTAVHIDTGQGLTTKPGDGVGVFVEYDGGGVWKLWTTCDTNKSGVTCGFDLYATAEGLSVLGLDDTEGSDFVDVGGKAAHASFDTASDTDGVTFQTKPNAVLELEAYIDGDSASPYVFWVGDGQVHSGAPSLVTDFWPN